MTSCPTPQPTIQVPGLISITHLLIAFELHCLKWSGSTQHLHLITSEWKQPTLISFAHDECWVHAPKGEPKIKAEAMSVTQSFASPATPASSPPALLPLLQFQLQLYCFCCNPSNSPVVSAVIPVQALSLLLQLQLQLCCFCCSSSASSIASA
eukprot:CAMPEP_0202366746 /NCGR_PEP_ID=MMETSP1126-20121109/17234_1 /ASSEMBLY_ACC=CAM_ASM_000457 /TAXON_ID=3047 /ORGANISM="Dunaliella tertiolecta, Strain CCMP1320" /LENGTH=152 /DNA_ID=CAMNT_0048961857 /DNA_START=1007 /DNA_END=1462 /DNA_ORIENTATION=+